MTIYLRMQRMVALCSVLLRTSFPRNRRTLPEHTCSALRPDPLCAAPLSGWLRGRGDGRQGRRPASPLLLCRAPGAVPRPAWGPPLRGIERIGRSGKLSRARSRLYRRQNLQVNMRSKVSPRSTQCTPLHSSAIALEPSFSSRGRPAASRRWTRPRRRSSSRTGRSRRFRFNSSFSIFHFCELRSADFLGTPQNYRTIQKSDIEVTKLKTILREILMKF